MHTSLKRWLKEKGAPSSAASAPPVEHMMFLVSQWSYFDCRSRKGV
jgi:hypothetical protein